MSTLHFKDCPMHHKSSSFSSLPRSCNCHLPYGVHAYLSNYTVKICGSSDRRDGGCLLQSALLSPGVMRVVVFDRSDGTPICDIPALPGLQAMNLCEPKPEPEPAPKLFLIKNGIKDHYVQATCTRQAINRWFDHMNTLPHTDDSRKQLDQGKILVIKVNDGPVIR